jgi:hypothetical protein
VASIVLERGALKPLAVSRFLNAAADGMSGEARPAPRGLPCFYRFQPSRGPQVRRIWPGECRYRDDLVAAYAEEAFDNYELQNFAHDENYHAYRDVTRAGQISSSRLDRLKNDQRESKQGKGGIRAERTYSDAKTSD